LWAVVGLGNPGRRYSETRHNAGFMFIKRIARDWDVKVKKRKFLSKTAEVETAQGRMLLALPQTFMNRSGEAVRALLQGVGIEPGNLVVIYDDIDLALGQIRVRKEGGPGTHKGMASIVEEIETTRFPRIRVGIGPFPEEADMIDYVLSPFAEREKPILGQSLDRAREALDMILAGQIDKAMNSYN
jgi:peptidyl-tRNA hydrolase, PTH1 family